MLLKLQASIFMKQKIKVILCKDYKAYAMHSSRLRYLKLVIYTHRNSIPDFTSINDTGLLLINGGDCAWVNCNRD